MFTFIHFIIKKYLKIRKIKTRGVRIILIQDNKVLLVQHRYNDLWVFPGGRIEKGESVYETARKEVREETQYIINNFNKILGVYKNTTGGKDDEVTILVSTDFYFQKQHSIKDKILRHFEIKHMDWYSLDKLPDTTSKATRERILEYQEKGDKQYNGKW